MHHCQALVKAAVFNKNILKLSLTFGRNFKFTDQDLRKMPQILKRLKSLQQLTLHLHDCSHITDKRLSYLAKGLQGLHCLQNLSFLFSIISSQFTDAGLVSLSQNFKRLSTLKSIRLQFPPLNQATDKGLKRLNGSFNHLRKLENITLRIPGCHGMIYRSLSNLRLKRLVSLQRVDLKFSRSPRLTKGGLEFLKQGLKGLPNLRKLKLDLQNCPEINDLGLHYIWELMMTLPCLREISLRCSDSWRISDEAFDDLNKTLGEKFPPLEKVKFGFGTCRSITDKGLVSLCEFLERFVDLRNFSVSFPFCNEITDLGVEKVIDFMSGQASLRKIGINFDDCKKVTGRSLNKIIQYFQNQSSLEKITLPSSGFMRWSEDIEDLERQRSNLRIKWLMNNVD